MVTQQQKQLKILIIGESCQDTYVFGEVNRISPEAPTRLPATIKTLLFMMKPVNAAAIPDSELSKLTTTGMSAPPIGRTRMIPSTHEIPIIAQM